jgi:hypothetical protein
VRRRHPAVPFELIWFNQPQADLIDIYLSIGVEQLSAAARYS